MKITASDLDELKHRLAAGALIRSPSRWTPTALVLFVPGALTNPLNATGWSRWKHRRWAKTWKYKTYSAILESGYRLGLWSAEKPKRVTFRAHVKRLFDDDNLRACIKPSRDSLVGAGILSTDAPGHGHEFVYEQIATRSWRGVEVRVEILAFPPIPEEEIPF